MCTGSISPHWLLRALQAGADGVFVGGCRLGECHYQVGNLMAERRVRFLQRLLEAMGIQAERLRARWVSSAEAAELAHELAQFAEEVGRLGPNPLRARAEGVREA